MVDTQEKTLRNVAPLKELTAIFGDDIRFEEFGKAELATILKKKPLCLHALAGNVWNRIVQKNWKNVNPQQLAIYFQRQDPKLHQAISKLIGEEVIRDIYYARAWRGVPRKANLVMEIVLADVYRSDLQLADITFCNPDRPIAPIDRRFSLQTHEGLGLLPILFANMHAYATYLGHEQLTLTAAIGNLVPLFMRHGFTIENSIAAKIAMNYGQGIPMERNIK